MHTGATITLVAAAALFAATIAVSTFATSALALTVRGAPQSQSSAQQANNNGLAGVNVGIGVQANGVGICVAALNSAC